jgi:transcriptional regulator with XRE-family HTH domain
MCKSERRYELTTPSALASLHTPLEGFGPAHVEMNASWKDQSLQDSNDPRELNKLPVPSPEELAALERALLELAAASVPDTATIDRLLAFAPAFQPPTDWSDRTERRTHAALDLLNGLTIPLPRLIGDQRKALGLAQHEVSRQTGLSLEDLTELERGNADRYLHMPPLAIAALTALLEVPRTLLALSLAAAFRPPLRQSYPDAGGSAERTAPRHAPELDAWIRSYLTG